MSFFYINEIFFYIILPISKYIFSYTQNSFYTTNYYYRRNSLQITLYKILLHIEETQLTHIYATVIIMSDSITNIIYEEEINYVDCRSMERL